MAAPCWKVERVRALHFPSSTSASEVIEDLNSEKWERMVTFAHEWVNTGKDPEVSVAKQVLEVPLGGMVEQPAGTHKSCYRRFVHSNKLNRSIEANRRRKVSQPNKLLSEGTKFQPGN